MLGVLPALASAQLREPEGRGFVAFYGGMQSAEGSSSASGVFSVYNESGRFEASQSHEGGGLFSLGGGVKIWKNLAIGVAYTRMTDTQNATASVTAPHPVLYDTPRSANTSVDGLAHEEDAIHLQALVVLPLGNRAELIVGGGPTFFGVKHDFITKVGFTEGASPYSAITVGTPEISKGDENTTGFNFGGELAVYFTKNVGAAGFFRYAKGTASFDVAGSTTDIDAGGTQFGGGLRIRF
ncbi:MAG: hypothetical protein JNM38_19060 [Acidobacteria bacterium]|jgi:hypothetical protein|nr:hypothetical protein [Acidobacteriota bacterium]